MRYLATIALALLVPAAAAEKVMVFEVRIWPNGLAEIGQVDVLNGKPENYPDAGSGELRVLSAGRDVLQSIRFAEPDGQDDGQFLLYRFALPFSPEAERVQVLSGGQLTAEKPIGRDLCSADGACSGFETASNCPADCLPARTESSFDWRPLLALLLAAMAALAYLRKRAKSV
ncbi:MAG: hypothetical protein HY519_01800 [Candidatus Aenigmarchaeota archaeon]|nr:hypothetical protein [Candidatus Aenigmarchaeota archaeon]